MATTRDEELRRLRFNDGVNNVAKEHALPIGEDGMPTAAREIVNFDIDNAGLPIYRRGYINRVAAGRAHSLCRNDVHLFAVVDGDLRAYVPNPDTLVSAGVVRAGVGDLYASAARAVDDLYWSNGVVIRRFGADLSDNPVWTPNPPFPEAVSTSYGGLAAGEYLVALTWVDAQGRESGATSSALDVPASGGIMLDLPAPAAGVSKVRVYCSAADGEVAYRVVEMPASTPAYHLGAFDIEAGRTCETMWHVPMPPGHIVRFWHGRLLVANGNLLHEGVPLRAGLMRHDSVMRVGAKITLMEPVGEADAGAGVWIADHKRTYWMAGQGFRTANRIIKRGSAAVPGTGCTLPGEKLGLDGVTGPVAAWLSTDGVLCLGLPGGTIVPWRENELALPVGGRGALHFAEHDGRRQILANFLQGAEKPLSITDRMSGTVRRNGVTLD